MKEKIITVTFEKGLHARPAALLVQAINGYNATIKIIKDDFEVDAKSIMGVLTLAAGPGSDLKFILDGHDEVEALSTIETFFSTDYREHD